MKHLGKSRHSEEAGPLSLPVYMRLYPCKCIRTHTYTKINVFLYNLGALSVMKCNFFLGQFLFICMDCKPKQTIIILNG